MDHLGFEITITRLCLPSFSESIGSDTAALPLFHQFLRDDNPHLSHALKAHSHNNQIVEEIFSATDRSMFDAAAKIAAYVPSAGGQLVSPSPADITPTPSDELSAPAPPHLPTPTAVMPVS